MHGHAILDHLQRTQPAMLEALRVLVSHETPSREKPALDAFTRLLARRLQALGAVVASIDNSVGGDHVVARFDLSAALGARPALILCHYDTVWPFGALAARPFHIEGERAYGPGVFDMKASLVLVEFALAALAKLGLAPPRPVALLVTSDEEIGSPTSREVIESQAKASDYVLVLEPPLAGGRLKTARKGVGRFTLEIEGRAAHAGVEPERGTSAIVELAHQVLLLDKLADPAAGTTINVGVVHAGTTPNVVPAHATATIDVRVPTIAEQRRLERAMGELQAVLPGARVTAAGQFDRPPMERTPAIAALFERARAIARSIGLELGEGSTGGGSDGNLTAALGVPTLDGLGAEGAGAHADNEHILIDSMPVRAALLALLLLEL
jgi:glutamate carboxypeptidase